MYHGENCIYPVDVIFNLSVVEVVNMSINQNKLRKVMRRWTSGFNGMETKELITGSPMIVGGLAYFDCKVINILEFSTNSLIIGEVIAADIGTHDKPLLYFDQQYHQLQE